MAGVKPGHNAAPVVMSAPLQSLVDIKKKKQYGGNSGRFSAGPHQLCIGELISNDDMNIITLAVPRAEQERKTQPFTKIYENDASCALLKISPTEEVKSGLSLIARFFVNNRYIILRGIALGMDEENSQMVKVMFTDELKIHSIARKALYHITPEFHAKSFLACTVELADVPNALIFKKHLKEFVDDYKSKEVSVQFERDGKSFQKAKISLSKGGPTLRQTLEQRILAEPCGNIPTKDHNAIGNICFAHSNGKIFMHMEGCIIESLTDYLADAYKLINKTGLNIKLDTETMYLVPFEEDVCRVRIEKSKAPGEVSVRYIDYGNHATVSADLLIPVALVDPFLEQIPPLCIGFKLKWVSKIVDILAFQEYFDTEYQVMVREEGIEGAPPTVVLVDPKKEEIDDDYYFNKYIIAIKLAVK